MKKIILLTICIVLLSVGISFAGSISLVDNVLLSTTDTGGNFSACAKRSDTNKRFVISGAIGDTFAVEFDGVVITTITLKASPELWNFNNAVDALRVDMSANGTEAVAFKCLHKI